MMDLIKKIKLQTVKVITVICYGCLRAFASVKKLNDEIVIVADPTQYGGTYTYIIRLTQSLLKNKLKVRLIVPENITNDLSIKLKNSLVYIQTLPDKYETSSNLKSLLKDISIAFKIYYYGRPKAIIISTGNPEAFITLLKLPNTIYILHTIPYKPLTAFHGWLVSVSKSKFVAISKFMKKQLIDKWKVKEQCLVELHNPITIETGRTSEYLNQNIILTVGHVENYKNPLLWIEAAKLILTKHKNLQFMWAGDGTLTDICQESTKNIRGITFLGKSTQKEIGQLMEKTLIYVQPSEIESFGLSVLDAMSFGIPCVVSSGHALEELVGNTGVVVKNFTAEAWSNAIINLVENKPLLNELSLKTQDRAVAHYSLPKWESQVNKLLNI